MAEPAPKITPIKPKPTSVVVSLDNRLMPQDPVGIKDAKVKLERVEGDKLTLEGVTNRWGNVTLPTTGIPSGKYRLQVTPPHTSTDSVGPRFAESALNPKRIYRSLDAEVEFADGAFTGSFCAPTDKRGTAQVPTTPTNVLKVCLQPLWMDSPNQVDRPQNTDITAIIIHRTDASTAGSSLQTFTDKAKGTSAHYLVDTDGQIVKLVTDKKAAKHAGYSHWKGQDALSKLSIGIEIVNKPGNDYTEAQYTALLGLLKELTTEHKSIDKQQILGHSDVGFGKGTVGVLGGRGDDPGVEFDWPRLEAEGYGIAPRPGPPSAGIYGGFFNNSPAGKMKTGDNDAATKFGGQKAVTELQNDLKNIGYSVTVSGKYDEQTKKAVHVFQKHFFSGRRRSKGIVFEQVDKQTAEMIKSVAPENSESVKPQDPTPKPTPTPTPTPTPSPTPSPTPTPVPSSGPPMLH